MSKAGDHGVVAAAARRRGAESAAYCTRRRCRPREKSACSARSTTPIPIGASARWLRGSFRTLHFWNSSSGRRSPVCQWRANSQRLALQHQFSMIAKVTTKSGRWCRPDCALRPARAGDAAGVRIRGRWSRLRDASAAGLPSTGGVKLPQSSPMRARCGTSAVAAWSRNPSAPPRLFRAGTVAVKGPREAVRRDRVTPAAGSMPVRRFLFDANAEDAPENFEHSVYDVLERSMGSAFRRNQSAARCFSDQ